MNTGGVIIRQTRWRRGGRRKQIEHLKVQVLYIIKLCKRWIRNKSLSNSSKNCHRLRYSPTPNTPPLAKYSTKTIIHSLNSPTNKLSRIVLVNKKQITIWQHKRTSLANLMQASSTQIFRFISITLCQCKLSKKMTIYVIWGRRSSIRLLTTNILIIRILLRILKRR